MSTRTRRTRAYGKKSTRTKAERLFAELPQSPVQQPKTIPKDSIDAVADKLSKIDLENNHDDYICNEILRPASPSISSRKTQGKSAIGVDGDGVEAKKKEPTKKSHTENDITKRERSNTSPCQSTETHSTPEFTASESITSEPTISEDKDLRILTWNDVCPQGDKILKIAEASYAEVYHVTNPRGTSIIKVIRLESPIKAQTKAQVRSGLVDEEPHSETDVVGELQISEWLADIPGFVVYKERYVVRGKATRCLLETHQAFQKKMKRQDPGRAQFYPSPSRYLDDTKFLVIELGDAGVALEDFELNTASQLWDVFFLEAIALARAEDIAMFEHRDLHEGNICIKQMSSPKARRSGDGGFFGHSGLDITILDYGLSRAEDLTIDFAKPIAFDLEKDLSIFTSTHAPQCSVYRRMRTFLLTAERKCLPPEAHDTPYAKGVEGPLSWEAYAPYTNVLWLAYLYSYLVENFRGDKKELAGFRKETRELWKYLDPEAEDDVPCFGSAEDIVCFGVEAGWVLKEHLVDDGVRGVEEGSIILSRDEEDG